MNERLENEKQAKDALQQQVAVLTLQRVKEHDSYQKMLEKRLSAVVNSSDADCQTDPDILYGPLQGPSHPPVVPRRGSRLSLPAERLMNPNLESLYQQQLYQLQVRRRLLLCTFGVVAVTQADTVHCPRACYKLACISLSFTSRNCQRPQHWFFIPVSLLSHGHAF